MFRSFLVCNLPSYYCSYVSTINQRKWIYFIYRWWSLFRELDGFLRFKLNSYFIYLFIFFNLFNLCVWYTKHYLFVKFFLNKHHIYPWNLKIELASLALLGQKFKKRKETEIQFQTAGQIADRMCHLQIMVQGKFNSWFFFFFFFFFPN